MALEELKTDSVVDPFFETWDSLVDNILKQLNITIHSFDNQKTTDAFKLILSELRIELINLYDNDTKHTKSELKFIKFTQNMLLKIVDYYIHNDLSVFDNLTNDLAVFKNLDINEFIAGCLNDNDIAAEVIRIWLEMLFWFGYYVDSYDKNFIFTIFKIKDKLNVEE